MALAGIPTGLEALGDAVITPSDVRYDAARQSFNGMLDRHPAIIVQPRTDGEVASLTGAGYGNYAPPDEPEERVRAAFGTERHERLAKVKARYDPDNVFRFNHNIAPATGRPS